MHNQSTWARHVAQVSKYLCDAVGHGADTALGKQSLTLAQSSLSSAAKAAHTPQELTILTNLARSLCQLQPDKIGD